MRPARRAVVVVLLVGSAATAGASAESSTCGFHEVAYHQVTYRENISCEEAKTVLRGLKGDRDFVPMACGRNRHVSGWKLQNLLRTPAELKTRYTRGEQVIHYYRLQNPENMTCPPQPGFSYDEPDA